jgi:hypothetical protein
LLHSAVTSDITPTIASPAWTFPANGAALKHQSQKEPVLSLAQMMMNASALIQASSGAGSDFRGSWAKTMLRPAKQTAIGFLFIPVPFAYNTNIQGRRQRQLLLWVFDVSRNKTELGNKKKETLEEMGKGIPHPSSRA